MKVAHPAGLPIFFAKGNHRPDNVPSITLITDNNIGLKPWLGGVTTASTHVIGDD
jgi:hypothetical protein